MSFLTLLASVCAATAGAKARTKQFPFEFGLGPPPALPADVQLLGEGPGFRLSGPFAAIHAVPLKVVSLNLPEDGDAVEGPPVVDGPLRDLLDFGSAMGAAVLRPEDVNFRAQQRRESGDDSFANAMELPLDALHVKMQEHVPAPLNVDDTNGKVRIFGTLPKNLNAKTLKVSVAGDDGRNILVKYFLGQDGDEQNVVGIDEHFALDFQPAGSPVVKYQTSTGDFELLLTRPTVKPRKDVDIDFEAGTAASAKPSHLRKAAAPEHLAATRPSRDAMVNVVAKAPAGKSGDLPLERRHLAPSKAKHGAPPQEFAHDVATRRVPAWVASPAQEFVKVTKELYTAAHSQDSNQDRAVRAKQVAERAKQFVVDAHLGEAKKELIEAFAPIDDTGLVMLEMNHRFRAH
jgi:hypothetical protein